MGISNQRRPALIAHVIFRFDYGGLENGLVNVVNGLSGGELRHAVIALTEASDFAERLKGDVPVYSIGKKQGKDPGAYLRLYRILRRLRPAVVHTRNLGTLDCAFIAWLAGVPVRIHGEHGWDIYDPDGTDPKYRRRRRLWYRFVRRVVTVSEHLQRWVVETVGVPSAKVTHICNGVDTARFAPSREPRPDSPVVIGSVTRFSAIKDPLNLVEAFIGLRGHGQKLRLLMIGDGELHDEAMHRLTEAGCSEDTWLPGSRDDIPEQLRKMHVFVLGSLREGISNTILEAMASGLPVIASDTGGNPELIVAGETGCLVPPGDRDALAAAIRDYVDDPKRRLDHGKAARDRVISRFSIETMVSAYERLYDEALDLSGS